MGFLDEIKNKMHLGGQQGYDQGYGQDDDYGYDDGYDDGYQNNGYSGTSGEGFYTQDERVTACWARRAAVRPSRSPCIRAPASWSAMTRVMQRRTIRRRVLRIVPQAAIAPRLRHAVELCRERPRSCRGTCARFCAERRLGLCKQHH